jgi:hypothetical protein
MEQQLDVVHPWNPISKAQTTPTRSNSSVTYSMTRLAAVCSDVFCRLLDIASPSGEFSSDPFEVLLVAGVDGSNGSSGEDTECDKPHEVHTSDCVIVL